MTVGTKALHDIILYIMVLPTPAAFPAKVDPNRGSEETVRSPGVLRSANGIADGVVRALSVESTSQTVRTNVHMAPKLAYRRGKWEGGEECVSEHQIRSEDGR